eukprot:GHVS01081497.1.p1 GENE.GHVS01081497.1~~GHVS01081497.1.p1  ORF type:complete len:162 (+),score=10.02 GHVS01081497.1:123-608(+)
MVEGDIIGEEGNTDPTLYSVILPTYNEKENLPYIIWLLVKYFNISDVKNFEIIVVDDNSPDGTAQVYHRLQKAFPDVRLLLIEREGKLGLGSAYVDALSHASGAFVVLMDADLSHHVCTVTAHVHTCAHVYCTCAHVYILYMCTLIYTAHAQRWNLHVNMR